MQTTDSREFNYTMDRMRRVGWLLLGDLHVVDNILDASWKQVPEKVAISLSKAALAGFEAADTGKGRVVILRPRQSQRLNVIPAAFEDRLRQLSFLEKTAAILLTVEKMELCEASVVTNRPGPILERALSSAMLKLELA